MSDNPLVGRTARQGPPPAACASCRCRAGSSFAYGGARIEVLAPPADYVATEIPRNNDSLVMRLAFGRNSFLLTGDMEKQIERELAQRGTPSAHVDVLKVAHHGSKTSSTAEFLDLARPEFAIISDGLREFLWPPAPGRAGAAGGASEPRSFAPIGMGWYRFAATAAACMSIRAALAAAQPGKPIRRLLRRLRLRPLRPGPAARASAMIFSASSRCARSTSTWNSSEGITEGPITTDGRPFGFQQAVNRQCLLLRIVIGGAEDRNHLHASSESSSSAISSR